MKYIIQDTMPCKVTWTFEIEASSTVEARELWQNGEATQVGEPIIGDTIEWASEINSTSIEPDLLG